MEVVGKVIDSETLSMEALGWILVRVIEYIYCSYLFINLDRFGPCK